MDENHRVRREFSKGGDISVRGMEVEGVFCRGEDQRIFFEKFRSAVRRFGAFLIVWQGIISPFL
jgi:hypothetical protein